MHVSRLAPAGCLEPQPKVAEAPQRRVLVLFEDRPEPSYLRLLRPGFRHCFCTIATPAGWTLLDPLKAGLEILSFSGIAEAELAQHFSTTGRVVLAGRIGPVPHGKPALPRLLTCVELVKRVLNLDAPTVFTPAQLCHRLIRQHGFVRFAGGPVRMD